MQQASRLPRSFTAALAVAAGFALFLIWDQWHWWRVKEDYMFGYLVPFFVGYVLYDRWPRIRSRATEPAGALASPGLRRLGSFIAAAALLAGLGGFSLGAFYRAGAGASQPASLAMALGFALTLIALVYLAGPDPAAPAGAMTPVPTARGIMAGGRAFLAEPRFRLACLFVFPALVWVVSAPLVSAVENTLSLFLLHKVTAVVFFIFDMLSLPLERHGNVLALPNGGSVMVEEACSGIRSLTGSIFAGSFLAAVFLDRLWKKVALVGAAVALAFATNLVRSLFLTTWAYRLGADAIHGRVHDITGYAILGVTFLGLLCLLPLFNLRLEPPSEGLEDDVTVASAAEVAGAPEARGSEN